MTPTQLAKLAGLSVRRINQLIKDTTLPATVSGSFPDEAEALRAMFTHFRTKGPSGAKQRYQEAQAGREELKLKRERRAVIDLKKAEYVWARVLMLARTKLLQLPHNIGSRTSSTTAQTIAQGVVNEALTELARDLGNYADTLDGDSD